MFLDVKTLIMNEQAFFYVKFRLPRRNFVNFHFMTGKCLTRLDSETSISTKSYSQSQIEALKLYFYHKSRALNEKE